jgi:hypothetical protein
MSFDVFRKQTRLVSFEDLSDEVLLELRTLQYEINNLRFPGWYGQIRINNESNFVNLTFNVQAITFNTATGQEATRILGGPILVSPQSDDNINLGIADRLTNINTILRINYRFDIDYPELLVSPPSSVTRVNNVPLRRQDFRFVDNSEFGNAPIFRLSVDPPPAGWGDASFGFINSSTFGNYLTFTVTTVSFNYITKVFDSSFVGQDSIAPGGTGLFVVSIVSPNNLRYDTSIFRISYSYVNGNTAVISSLSNATIVSESPGQIDLLPGASSTNISFELS